MQSTVFPGLEAQSKVEPKKIASGTFTGVVTANCVTVATNVAAGISVYTYNQLLKTWLDTCRQLNEAWSNEELHADILFGLHYVTLAVMQSNLFICGLHANKCSRFSLNDNRFYKYDALAINNTLGRPFMCDSDENGNILIVDSNNHRVVVVTESGQTGVVQLDYQVSHPRAALLFKDKLFVSTYDTRTNYIYKFMHDKSN